jgi:YD repeat-containing protein
VKHPLENRVWYTYHGGGGANEGTIRKPVAIGRGLDDGTTQLTRQIPYTNAVIATPSVSFTYDSVYGRVVTMGDGIGTTTYGYHAVTTPPALGAGQLASVDGPLTDDTITYTYDELGRVTTRAINGSANTVTWGFDALAASPQKRTCWGRSATRMTERRRAWRP